MLESKELLEMRQNIKKCLDALVQEFAQYRHGYKNREMRRSLTMALKLMRPLERTIWKLSQFTAMKPASAGKLMQSCLEVYFKHYERLTKEISYHSVYEPVWLKHVADLQVLSTWSGAVLTTPREIHDGYVNLHKTNIKNRQALEKKKAAFIANLSDKDRKALHELVQSRISFSISDFK